MKTATVIATTDGGQADRLRDEDGVEWESVVDSTDGTIAVETRDHYPPRAGIATWQEDDTLAIAVMSEGDTYDVGVLNEWIVCDGKWITND